MADTISTPSGMGGLMRYNEEYPSKFKISPTQVVIIILAVILVMAFLKLIF